MEEETGATTGAEEEDCFGMPATDDGEIAAATEDEAASLVDVAAAFVEEGTALETAATLEAAPDPDPAPPLDDPEPAPSLPGAKQLSPTTPALIVRPFPMLFPAYSPPYLTTSPGAGKTTGVPSTVEQVLTLAFATKIVGVVRGVVD